MKQYTTQPQELRMVGQGNLLLIADRVVVAAASDNGNIVTWEGHRLSIDGDKVSWKMTAEETAKLCGSCKVEITVFSGDDITKTKTAHFEIRKSVWDNGASDE